MANIAIIDTGYVGVETSGTQFTGTDIVNDGTAVVLKAVDINYDGSSNTDPTVEPDNSSVAEVNQVSTNNPKIVITGIFNRGGLNGSGTEFSVIPYLDGFRKTKGIKCLYYNDSVTDTSGYPVLTKFLGITDSEEGHPSEKHIHIRVNRFTFKQNNLNRCRFTLECEETG